MSSCHEGTQHAKEHYLIKMGKKKNGSQHWKLHTIRRAADPNIASHGKICVSILKRFHDKICISCILQDSADGRNLAILASAGKKTFQNHVSYFLRLSDDQVREIDPDLYPFMVAASDENSDISAVYLLLKRNPSLVGSLVVAKLTMGID